jgi:hypothetical protein
MKNDCNEIPQIYEKFKKVCDPECKDNRSIFILIIVFMYNPISFSNGHISRGKIRKSIAGVLGLSNSSVSVYFSNAKSLILNHNGFRKEVERVFSLLAS